MYAIKENKTYVFDIFMNLVYLFTSSIHKKSTS